MRKALGRDDLKVADWLGLNARFVGALQVERVMMFIILTLIVLVAAMNVVASFTMLVRVKRGSIAILRTMGAAPGTIVRAFFLSAAAVGIVGTAVGTGARPAGLRQHARRSRGCWSADRAAARRRLEPRSSSSPRRRCASSRPRC